MLFVTSTLVVTLSLLAVLVTERLSRSECALSSLDGVVPLLEDECADVVLVTSSHHSSNSTLKVERGYPTQAV